MRYDLTWVRKCYKTILSFHTSSPESKADDTISAKYLPRLTQHAEDSDLESDVEFSESEGEDAEDNGLNARRGSAQGSQWQSWCSIVWIRISVSTRRHHCYKFHKELNAVQSVYCLQLECLRNGMVYVSLIMYMFYCWLHAHNARLSLWGKWQFLGFQSCMFIFC